MKTSPPPHVQGFHQKSMEEDDHYDDDEHELPEYLVETMVEGNPRLMFYNQPRDLANLAFAVYKLEKHVAALETSLSDQADRIKTLEQMIQEKE